MKFGIRLRGPRGAIRDQGSSYYSLPPASFSRPGGGVEVVCDVRSGGAPQALALAGLVRRARPKRTTEVPRERREVYV